MQDDGKIVIRLLGTPKPKRAPEHRLVSPKSGGKPFIQSYPNHETAKFESQLRFAAHNVMQGRRRLLGPLKVDIFAFREMPELPAWKRYFALLRPPRWFPTTKPDWDNHAKVIDALNGLVWKDDAQIVDGRVRKIYSETPELVVIAEEIPLPTIDDYRALMRLRKGALPDAPQLALPAPEPVDA